MKRTQDEIVERINKIREMDFFGFQATDLISFLDYQSALPFLKDGTKQEEWQTETKSPARLIEEYMPFALDKAEDHRGLSAERSINHMTAWLWLDGNDDLVSFAENEKNYLNYGVPILRKICESYGIPFPMDDSALVGMSEGRGCGETGCGCFG